MQNNEKNQTLSDFYYDVAACGYARVGDKNLHSEVGFDWFSDSTRKFAHWECGRIWCVDKGYATAVTSFGKIELKEKTAYYIPQGTLISSRCDNFMAQYFVDFFSFSDFIPLNDLFDFNLSSDDYEVILQLVKDVIACKKLNSPLVNFRRNADINAVLAHFISGYKLSFSKLEPFTKIVNRINADYMKELTVQELAESIGYNVEYFSRAFKSAFSVSPQTYIINKRMSVAKHYLLTTSASVSLIAEKCGYRDSLYFSKAFAKHVGISPTDFRKLIQRPSF